MTLTEYEKRETALEKKIQKAIKSGDKGFLFRLNAAMDTLIGNDNLDYELNELTNIHNHKQTTEQKSRINELREVLR